MMTICMIMIANWIDKDLQKNGPLNPLHPAHSFKDKFHAKFSQICRTAKI